MFGKRYIFKAVDEISESIPEGVVFFADSYFAAGLKCPCGCGDDVFLRIDNNEHPCWQINGNSITPSIQRTLGCKSHFHITNGIVTE